MALLSKISSNTSKLALVKKKMQNGGADNDGHEIAGHENGGPNSRT